MTVDSKGSHGEPVVTDPPTHIADFAAQAAYAALVGNRIANSAANRTAFASHFGFTPFLGLEYRETDTGNIYFHNGTNWVGIKSQAGGVSFAATVGGGVGDFTAAGSGFEASKNVTFVAGRFTSPPIVTPGIFTVASADQHAGVANVTTSGFTLYYWRATQTTTTVGWAATPTDS